MPNSSPATPTTAAWKFLRNALTYGGGTLANQAVSFLLLPIYTRFLVPADYGILDILYKTGDVVVVMLMGQGLSGATFTFYCQARNREAQAVIAATTVSAIWAIVLIGLLGVFWFASPLSGMLGISEPQITRLGLVAAFSQLLLVVPMSLLQARMESLTFVCISLVSAVARFAIILLAVVVLRAGIEGVLWGTIISYLATAGFLSIREFRRFGFRPDIGQIPSVLKFALPFVPLGLLGFFRASSDRFFLLEFWGANDVGIYAFATRIASIISALAFAPLFKVWSAWLYQVYSRTDGPDLVGRYLLRLVAPYIFGTLGLVLFRHEIVHLLGDQAYVAAAVLIAPICVAQGFEVAQTLLDGTFYFNRRSMLKLWITAATTVVSVGFNALLIPRFGLNGAATSFVIQSAFFAALTYVVAQRVYRVNLEWNRLLLGVGIAVGLALPTFYGPFVELPSIVKLLLWLVWPLAIWWFGGIRLDEKAMVKLAATRGLRTLARPRTPH